MLTPTEQELLDIYRRNAKDGQAENVHRICLKHDLDYSQALRYNKRLETKGVISKTRCGTGRACPLSIILEKNLK